MTASGDRVRWTREQAGLSRGQAARLLGLTVEWVTGVEHGTVIPTGEQLKAMAVTFGCAVAWLQGAKPQLNAQNEALLRSVTHDGDRATLREFMEMLSVRDPGAPVPGSAAERLAAVSLARHGAGLGAETKAAVVHVPISEKRAYVKRQRQTRAHHCHWPGCEAQVPPAMWGCRLHWGRLPKALRDRIWAAYMPGQERDMSPSADYLHVADDVQRWIREHGVRP